MKVILGKEILVYSVPVNESTQKWGVYSIPRLWRDISGKLIVRFNGEMDCGDTDHQKILPNLHFVSQDQGITWMQESDGDSRYPCDILNGIGTPYTSVEGYTLAFREQSGRKPIHDAPHQKEFLMPNGEAIVYSYRYGDIPEDCKGMEQLRYTPDGKTEVLPVVIDFPEREILINTRGEMGGEYAAVEQRVKQNIFKNTYFSSVTPLPDGTLIAVSCGQNPAVHNRYCGAAYLLESSDLGRSWKKRSTIAESVDLPYGYTGDGHEVSLALTESGVLICAMRMDMSINPDLASPICDTMIAISRDYGYSWEMPFSIADSSVTPQAIAFANGITAVVYGRPGVHFKYSDDDGKTWSRPVSIIGKTLEEYRKAGISDGESKYFDTPSYSNVFVEKLSGDTMLVLYNNAKYDEGDGVPHKAAFVRTVTFSRE